VSRGPLVVVGDALLDVDVRGTVSRTTPDGRAPVVDCADRRERPGGAALAALLAAAPGGRDVVLIAGLGDDEAGDRVAAMLAGTVSLVRLPLTGGTPAKTRVMTPADMLLRLDTGQGRVLPDAVLPPDARLALAGAAAVLVADYGRGTSVHPRLSAALAQITGRIPVVWDPHPRGGRPLAGARLVTPNEAEALAFATRGIPRAAAPGALGRRAQYLAQMWEVSAVAVTLGPRGAVLASGSEPPTAIPAARVSAPDTCGAGDSFAAAATRALADGLPLTAAVARAVQAATQFVAAGAASEIRTEGESACPLAVPSAQS
jgi:D-beta-D-heptose 7-phosphate kinase / D-beta-D-heptose 1-phosphate adenosyltransferase